MDKINIAYGLSYKDWDEDEDEADEYTSAEDFWGFAMADESIYAVNQDCQEIFSAHLVYPDGTSDGGINDDLPEFCHVIKLDGEEGQLTPASLNVIKGLFIG